jgi:hypothetical protein
MASSSSVEGASTTMSKACWPSLIVRCALDVEGSHGTAS